MRDKSQQKGQECEILQGLQNFSTLAKLFSTSCLPSGSIALSSNLFLHARAASLSSLYIAYENYKNYYKID